MFASLVRRDTRLRAATLGCGSGWFPCGRAGPSPSRPLGTLGRLPPAAGDPARSIAERAARSRSCLRVCSG
eukprot:8770972-Pyramimonas_sp.AAC.2